MTIDRVGPSVAPGHQPNVVGTSAAQAPLQKVKPGNWASPGGSSALTHNASPAKRARTLIREAIADSKRDRGALRENLADAFRKADPDVREAMRGHRVYKKIVREWASEVGDALNGARTTIHEGDQGMRKLHRIATGLPRELAADLVVAATPIFRDYSTYIVKHNKGNGAIFSSNDRVLVSMPSPGEETSKPDPEASKPNPNVEASKSSPAEEASKSSPAEEASKLSPGDAASKPSNEASMPKYEKYTYFDDLKAWIGGAEIPNPKQDDAVRQLEALVDKS
jgi:hypothetical protein